MKVMDTYKEVKRLNFPNMKVNVFIPDITDEERQKRMERIKAAAVSLVLSERS